MPRKIVFLILIACIAFSSTSCSTIVCGRNQDLPVVSRPSGAVVTVGTMKQMSPATFVLDRRQGVYVVKVEKEGYESVEVVLKKGINGWVFGNIVFGGIIGLVIDISTGAASKFNPTEIDVNLIDKKIADNNIKGKDVLFVKLIESKKSL